MNLLYCGLSPAFTPVNLHMSNSQPCNNEVEQTLDNHNFMIIMRPYWKMYLHASSIMFNEYDT